MKFTTTTAIAVAATGAAAQDGWSSWASSSTSSKPADKSTCAAPTVIKTETTTAYKVTSEVYQKTVTIPIPEKPATVSIDPVWANWDKSSTSSSKKSSSTGPAGSSTWSDWDPVKGSTTSSCDVKKTVTSTSTITSTVPGTTTITKSILFVGAKVTGGPEAEWNNWPAAGSGSGSGSSSGSGSGSGSGWGSGSGSGSGSGNGWGSGSGSSSDNGGNGGFGGKPGNGNDNDGSNGNKGWGQGSWGGSGTGGLVIGEGNDVFHWEAPVPKNTASGVAPEYTKRPDGSYGGKPWGGAGEWGNWDGPDGSSGSDGSGSGGKKNGTAPADGGKTNGTSGPAAEYGSPASNMTKPTLPLTKGDQYNSASDRSKWIGGLSIDTDYYKNYFQEEAQGYKGIPYSAGGPQGRTCDYELTLSRGKWNADGAEVDMMLINGQFPGPAIECNWGDLVRITVHNNIDKNGTAIHWHGIRQVNTNDQDGVPGVTECALAPGKTKTYTWRASSYGTSWYHSHWNLQYGDGIQGPIIIHGPATANYDVDAGPVMISDTYGMSATAFGSLIAHLGPLPVDNYLLNGKNTKTDLSAGQHSLWEVEKGKKYLFRFINSAAQNMYSISIDGHKMKVIAADFVPIEPYDADWVAIGIGQRYDVVVEMNQAVDTYFLRAVTQTACPSGSKNTGLGQANGIIAYKGADVGTAGYQLPTSTLNGNLTANDFRICQDEPLAKLKPWLKKNAGTLSSFQSQASTINGGQVGKVATSDDGAVFRWLLNGGAMYVNYTQPTIASIASGANITDNSTIYANHITLRQKDQWVYFVIQNQFFAAHPMHLHGHDFSILGQGDGLFDANSASSFNFDNPMRRDTAMLKGAAPGANVGGYTVIGFETDNPGAWLMHCHIAWHVDGGLALQWIERPDDIKASPYNSQSAFEGECNDYSTYQSLAPEHNKFSGQSGLKKREPNFFDRTVAEINKQYNAVVRRDQHAAHSFLSSHMKRRVGDANGRRFGRRR